MDSHTTLNMLLDSLFRQNSLNNWNIFEDKTGSVVVKLRFSPSSTKTNGHIDNDSKCVPLSYRRKSDSQVKRDHDRAARHRVNTSTNSAVGSACDVTPSVLMDSKYGKVNNSETDPTSPISSVDPPAMPPASVPSTESSNHDQAPVHEDGTSSNDTALLSDDSATQNILVSHPIHLYLQTT